MLSRRGLITGLISLAAAPAIVRSSSLMPVKSFKTKEQIINEAILALDAYAQSILEPMMNKLAEGIANQILYGGNVQHTFIDELGNLNVENYPAVGLSRSYGEITASSFVLPSRFEYKPLSLPEVATRYPKR